MRKTLIEELEKGPYSKFGSRPYNPGEPEYVPLKVKKQKKTRKYLEGNR